MNFLDAAKRGKWIRRRLTTKVLCISETPSSFYSITKSDLMADDWEIVDVIEETQAIDDATLRFLLIELD